MQSTVKPSCACGRESAARGMCMRCYMREQRANDPLTLRRQYLRRVYHITPEQYESIMEAQNGQCGICGTDDPGQGKYFEIDHDHSCCDKKGSCGKCVRGALCTACNTGISRFKDDADKLRKAADYIESHSL